MSAMHRERTFKEELPAHRDLGYSRTKITFTALTSTRTESPFFTPRSARVSSVMTEVISIGPSTLTLTWLIREPFLISATFPTTLFRAPYFMQPSKEEMLSRDDAAHRCRMARELKQLARVGNGGSVYPEYGDVVVHVVSDIQVLAIWTEYRSLRQAPDLHFTYLRDLLAVDLQHGHRSVAIVEKR